MSCGARPWRRECIQRLLFAVLEGDTPGFASWIVDHVGTDDEAWSELCGALATFAGSSLSTVMRSALRARGVPDSVPVVVGPGEADDPLARDVWLLVTMTMNQDAPGVLGVLAALRDRQQLDEAAGALAAIAGSALRREAALSVGGAL